jgi:hypothetical protein
MIVPAQCDLNDGEVFKGVVHLLLFGLTTMCLGHNLLMLSQRRQRHSLVNSLVYAGLTLFELGHIHHHLVPENTVRLIVEVAKTPSAAAPLPA